jgi:predicted nucleotidyltransferase
MTASITNLLKELKEALQEIYGSRLRGLYLYGSYARGDEIVDSDVDVLVVLDQIASYGGEIDRTGHVVSGLSLKYGVSISRIFVSELDWSQRPTSFLANVGDEAIPA